MTFKQWLRQFRDQENAIGDLARDVEQDTDFPRSQKKDEIEQYLINFGVGEQVISTFRRAWKKYLGRL